MSDQKPTVRLLTVKEYAHEMRLHPLSIYRRIREGRQAGVRRSGASIRIEPPRHDSNQGG